MKINSLIQQWKLKKGATNRHVKKSDWEIVNIEPDQYVKEKINDILDGEEGMLTENQVNYVIKLAKDDKI